MFPFSEPPDITLLLLVRDAQSAAAALGAVGVSKVEDVLREAINRFRDRVNAFDPAGTMGYDRDGWFIADPSGFDADLCRMLGSVRLVQAI